MSNLNINMKNLRRALLSWDTFLLVIILLEVLIFGLINPKFWRIGLLLNSIDDFLIIGVVALSMTFVIITGGIDISAGSMIGLSSVVTGLLWQVYGMNIWLAAFFAILSGILCGMLNGFLVSYLDIQAMVVTLGTSFLFSGIALVLMRFAGVSAYEGISGFPQSFKSLMSGHIIPGLPNSIFILIILVLISLVLLSKSKYGRYVILTGINQNAAIYSGINTRIIKMSAYMLVGMSSAFSGILLSSYLNSSRSDFGAETTLSIITAVVLGGTLITGGKGSVIGTLLATFVLGFMKFGLQMARVPTQYTNIPTGVLLIIASLIGALSGNSYFRSRLKLVFNRPKKSVNNFEKKL